MKPISNARIVIISLVALLSIAWTYPTARYYLQLTQQPAMVGQRPLADTSRPPESQPKEVIAWEERNPTVVAWEKQNEPFLAWEKKADDLRKNAIPLGLDLLGGVDVTLALDREKTVVSKLINLRESLRRDFTEQKLSVQFQEGGDPTRITVKLINPPDAQTVANLINKNYGGVIDATVDPADLARGAVTFGYQSEAISEELKGTLAGAMKALSERINDLGVTQPKISIQGTDRIRVQVPGEKDPDRVIRNVIRPADLEFHLVAENDTQYLGPDFRIPEGTELPAGMAKFPGKIGEVDPQTREITYSYRDFVLLQRPELTGADLRSAGVVFVSTDLQSPIQVSLEFKPDGARKFAELTKKYSGAMPQRQIAILLDGVVRSHPNIDEPILDGRGVIRGGFSQEEATELSQILKAGSLPAPLKIMSKRTVGATLGADSIASGVRALIYGTVAVAIFMIAYYGMAGVIAIIALILNTLIVFAIMAMFRATLTLSGIGGILLTIGMAVDANVLIYERIREEVEAGRTLRQAIRLGFERAFSVILDSNMTTLLSSVVLLQFAEGSVFGFALTTSFGLLANLFTGLTVTYTLCALWFQWRDSLSLGKLTIFKNPKFDFVGMRKYAFIFSAIFLVLIPLSMVVRQGGLSYGVDFAGGVSTDIKFHDGTEHNLERLRKVVADAGIPDPRILNIIGEPNAYVIESQLITPAAGGEGTAPSAQALPEATEAALIAALNTVWNGQYDVIQTESFSSQSGAEFQTMAFLVAGLTSIAILFYLWLRFELVFGVVAVISLLHDLIGVILISSAIFNVQISLDIVAALMVLMGFSVNDKIVIFDRIREDARLHPSMKFRDICNLSVNQSLGRSIITSGTVFLSVLMLRLVGGEGLAPFATVLIVGVLVISYCTDFIPAALVFMWNEHRGHQVQQLLAEKRKKKIEAAKPVRTATRRAE